MLIEMFDGLNEMSLAKCHCMWMCGYCKHVMESKAIIPIMGTAP